MSYNLDSFCPEPWSQIEIDSSGDYKICCLANLDPSFGMALDQEGRVMNVMTHSIKEAINSQTHRQHRLALKENQKPPRCRSCYDSEAVTKNHKTPCGVSKRQRVIWDTAINTPGYVTWETADQFTDEQGFSSAAVVNLDLRFSNLCNYKCIMCSPRESSLWLEDWVKLDLYQGTQEIRKSQQRVFKIQQDDRGRSQVQGLVPWWETETWWARFEEIMPQLGYIYFTGGEPLLVPAMTECLDRMINRGLAKNIELRYDTNLSVINPRVIERWREFRKVDLCISMDDIEDRYELIRFPGKYATFIKNLDQLQAANTPITYISSCIGLASIYSMTRVAAFAESRGLPSFFRFLEGPEFFDLRILPTKIKLEIQAQLSGLGGSDRCIKWYQAEHDLLEQYRDYENPQLVKRFMQYMTKLDQIRGTNWRKTLPDIWALLIKHGFWG